MVSGVVSCWQKLARTHLTSNLPIFIPITFVFGRFSPLRRGTDMNWDWSASQRCVTDMNWELECQSPSRHLKTLATGVPANSWSLQVPVWHCVHHGWGGTRHAQHIARTRGHLVAPQLIDTRCARVHGEGRGEANLSEGVRAISSSMNRSFVSYMISGSTKPGYGRIRRTFSRRLQN